MQTQIKFIVSGANSVYGGFSAGDLMRVPKDIAAHFVELGLAKYTETPDETTVEAPIKRTRKAKE